MGVNKCCDKPENLVFDEARQRDLIVRKCKVCGRRHYELSLDPVRLGLKLGKSE